MSNNDCFLNNYGGLRANSLNYVLNNDNSDSLDGEPMTFKHSSYIDDDELIDQLKKKRNTFTILSLIIVKVSMQKFTKSKYLWKS